jgi:serine/threonine protein kinase/tetratricopeptide (TPR) repeat protein
MIGGRPMERIGKYVIVGKIGHGAMGEVYKAHDPILNRHVAVKTMSSMSAADTDLVQRFQREAQSAARLNHTNIVTVFDFGQEKGQFYMAMELLEGVDLKELIAGRGLNDLWDKLDVMEQVCDGLAYAHAQGVVHRDLKPANLRVLPSGRVKIMDFGLARLGASEMTAAGMIMGTPNYMSPEQVKGQKAEASSDIFSLGAVFYELLSGQKAFHADSMHTILYKVLEEQPEPMERRVPSLPPPFIALVDRALQKDAARRFPNAGEMREALREIRESLSTGQYDPATGTMMDGPGAVDPGAPTMVGATATTLGGKTRFPTKSTSLRPATSGTGALDLRRLPVEARRSSQPRTLNGRASTEMGEEAFEEDAPPSRWPIYAGAGVLAIGIAAAVGIYVLRPQPAAQVAAPAPDRTVEQVGALQEALVSNNVELARVDLENKDYQAAISRADSALRLSPDNPDARQVLDQARRSLAELNAAASEARQAFEAGDTTRASQALGRVLALDPRHPVAAELSAALNVHFRRQAEDARRASDEARRGAEQVRAGSLAGFGAADRAAREGAALLGREEFAFATQKFLESRDAFDRARREAEANARQAAAQAAQQAAAQAAAAQAAQQRPTTVPPAPTSTQVANVPPAVTLPPAAPGATIPAAPTASVPTGPVGSPHEPAIRKVIADYGRAIEGKDIALFRTVKPNLSGDEAKRLQEAFKAIKSQQVGINIEKVDVVGDQATVRISRQDTINGKQVQRVQQVFRMAQSGGAWVIQSIGQ